MEVKLIAAVNLIGVIGNEGKLPWKNKAELQHFKETTMGKALIMGRKTYEGLPKKLKGRKVYVVSSQDGYYDSVERAIKAAENDGYDEVFIAGGASIYSYCLRSRLVDSAIISLVHDMTFGDVHFDTKALTDYSGLNLFYHENHDRDGFTVQIYSKIAASMK